MSIYNTGKLLSQILDKILLFDESVLKIPKCMPPLSPLKLQTFQIATSAATNQAWLVVPPNWTSWRSTRSFMACVSSSIASATTSLWIHPLHLPRPPILSSFSSVWRICPSVMTTCRCISLLSIISQGKFVQSMSQLGRYRINRMQPWLKEENGLAIAPKLWSRHVSQDDVTRSKLVVGVD